MSAPETATAFNTRVEGKGEVSHEVLAYLGDAVDHALRFVEAPVSSARAMLTLRPDHSVDHRARAEVSVHVNGTITRAQTFAPTLREAVDALVGKLEAQLRKQSSSVGRESIRKGEAAHDWDQNTRPVDQSVYTERDPDDRTIVRHKTFGTLRATLDEARWDMDQLDYDFFLFCDDATNTDAVVSRQEDGSVELRHLGEVTTMGTDQAITWLNETGARFVFYRDLDTDRGAVIYRRYDGNYGLLTPR